MNDTKLIPLNQSDLNSSYTEEVRIELQKLYKTELIVKILKQQNSPISVDGRALLSMHLNDNPLPLGRYNHFKQNENVRLIQLCPRIGLDRIRNVELNYLDRLKVNEFLENEITVRTKCVVDKMTRISGNKLNSLAHPSYKDYLEVLDLEAEKRKLTEELIRLKNRKVHFMNLCAEMRTGPYQKNTVETKNAECKTLQIKAE